ncbi:MAG: M4 family metallopeptidase [Calditrichaeota bacterium]|nr:M4 family metallopeptidase [Calditrichota bacterium]MCB9472543.1 M4 family metallopeptidase [Candidatus Delongbacteria bacterium]
MSCSHPSFRRALQLGSCLLALGLVPLGSALPGTAVRSADGAHLAALIGSPGAPLWPASGSAVATARAFVQTWGDALELQSQGIDLQLKRQGKDPAGAEHLAYDLFYKNRLLFGQGVVLHFDSKGALVSLNGRVPRLPGKVDAGQPIDVQQVADRLMDVTRDWNPRIGKAELVWVNLAWLGLPDSGLRLAWHIEGADFERAVEQAILVDALSGELMNSWSLIHTVQDRRIYNGNGGSALPGTLARSEGQAATGNFDIDAAYDYYGDTYGYFWRGHGRDSIDGLGLPMVATTHSTSPPCPNAYWSDGLQQMVFCNGTVTDDVVAHELTHGVTSNTAGLIYQNQSGQLNESFSDVFGELVDLYNGDASVAGAPGGVAWPAHGTGPGLDTPNNARSSCSTSHTDGVRWLIGEDAAAFGGEIRDMWDPTCLGDPDYANSPLQTCPSGDSGGVHSGSGIPNHAFAILVDGKDYNGYSVSGIGTIKAGAIWYQTLAWYLVPSSDFEDAYLAFNLAGSSLLGVNLADPRTGLASGHIVDSSDLVQLDRALRAVEMNTEGACGGGSSVLSSDEISACPAGDTFFSEDFEAGLGSWTVSHSAMPTPYDWVGAGNLPVGRAGNAAWCEDRNVGDCAGQDETGSHTLTSPWIQCGTLAGRPLLSFRHFVNTEGGYDGCIVQVQTAAGTTTLGFDAWLFNPPNAPLNAGNPFSGIPGFTGNTSSWGHSLADLGPVLAGADSLRLVFSLGKDGCTGSTGWYVDDVRLIDCGDCDQDGNDDQSQFLVSGTHFMPMPSTLFGESWSPGDLPPADDTVTLCVSARGDLSSPTESVTVDLNGTVLGTLFASGASDCPGSPSRRELDLSPAVFNAALGAGADVFGFHSSSDVNTTLCGPSNHMVVTLKYRHGSAGDLDNDWIPDGCQSLLPAPAAELSYSGNSLTLSWNPVPGASSYRVLVTVDGVVEDLGTTAATSMDLSSRLAVGPSNQVETVRVIALD